MTFNFLGPGLTVNVEAKVKEQIILDSSEINYEAVCPESLKPFGNRVQALWPVVTNETPSYGGVLAD